MTFLGLNTFTNPFGIVTCQTHFTSFLVDMPEFARTDKGAANPNLPLTPATRSEPSLSPMKLPAVLLLTLTLIVG